ncbi:MAG: SufD family Fe-S cluster assembly protein, partial [Spirochaetaceae bacterium]|nr:SufD family Fe-S cluster assembly protein [Spirochaetaceae bacterium]
FEGAPAVNETVTPVINAGLSAFVGANALVDITLRQNLGNRVVFFLHERLDVGRDGRIEFRESHLGGALVKTRTRVLLSAEGADARIKGLYIVGDGRHFDIGTIQEHRSPRATSNALYKGAVYPGGRSVFGGLIEVAPKAAKTDAYLTNKNLVLGEGARADSIPQLNILTDDVKCSHGSTTGKLDAAHLFYLESRGFSPTEAQRELPRGFLAEVIAGAPDAVAEILADDLDLALSAS